VRFPACVGLEVGDATLGWTAAEFRRILERLLAHNHCQVGNPNRLAEALTAGWRRVGAAVLVPQLIEPERLDIDVLLGICAECAEYGGQHWVLVQVCTDVVQTGKGDELRIGDLTRRPLRSVEEVDICCADEEETPELP
jgi:hypothetical protein